MHLRARLDLTRRGFSRTPAPPGADPTGAIFNLTFPPPQQPGIEMSFNVEEADDGDIRAVSAHGGSVKAAI